MQLLSLAIEGSFNLPMIIGGCTMCWGHYDVVKDILVRIVYWKDPTLLDDLKVRIQGMLRPRKWK